MLSHCLALSSARPAAAGSSGPAVPLRGERGGRRGGGRVMSCMNSLEIALLSLV